MLAQQKTVVVFDICDTLYYSNTTFDFIYFFLKHKEDINGMKRFEKYTDRKSIYFWMDIIFGKIFHQDFSKAKVVSLLKGYSREELFYLANKFVDFLNSEKKIDRTQALLEQYQASQYKIILCSASLDPVVAAIAKKLNVDYICSHLLYDKVGICSGQLIYDVKGAKYEALKTLLGKGNSFDLIVVSDNKSDRTLFEHAQERFFVVYSDKDVFYWKDLKGHYIRLNREKYLHD